ncbi:MAG TPA: putative sulfate exporter family transporter [Nevskiaceae bacterium]|nr:putative sulfate exporter family transporter [Nevskiaceae bacterium]
MTSAAHRYGPGLVASGIVAIAATSLSEHYGASAMLYALLLGMAVNFLSVEGRCVPGIALAAKSVLRLGVALLGMRLTLDQVVQFGWGPLLIVVASVATTIGVGYAMARVFGLHRHFGLLSGGSVAICGASAAMALAAAFPSHEKKERALIFTVIGVSTLSTAAMVLYPLLARALGFDDLEAGLFLGATIHDVAQVVGAGYGMSQATGDTATVVKLMRVALLLPVVVMISLGLRIGQPAPKGDAAPLLPAFAVGFAVLMLINSTGWVPVAVQDAANVASRACLVTAIAAIGMKTQLKEIVTVGWRPVALMLGETVFLAALVIGLMRLLPIQ